MNDVLCSQLSIDFCCSMDDVRDDKNHFNEHKFLEGRRRFQEKSKCYLKIAVVGGKLLFAGDKDIIKWCKSEYENEGSSWFLEVKNMRKLNDKLHKEGYRLAMMHPFYISEEKSDIKMDNNFWNGYEIKIYDHEGIEQFRGNDKYSEAYTFLEEAPDVIGISASKDGEILGMAGASADSPTMWQIGINVEDKASGDGLAKTLVGLIKNEILDKGILPYYGTGFSHLASQRVALACMFKPSWVEIATEKIEED